MSRFTLEDFGSGSKPVAPAATSRADAERFDEGYNAGWDDAMAQIESEQARVSEALASRLAALEQVRSDALASAVETLEPTLRDIFDRLLPHMAQRAFLPVVMEEIRGVLDGEADRLSLLVAPEDAPALTRLLERAEIAPDRASVRPEAALSISQALIRWDGRERRIDMEGALDALDDALETFLATTDRAKPDADLKEAMNG